GPEDDRGRRAQAEEAAAPGGVQQAVPGHCRQGSLQETDPRGAGSVERPSELHCHGGGFQGGAAPDDPPEDMHEQCIEAAATQRAVVERPVDEGPVGPGEPVHGNPEHQGVQVCTHQGPV
ncbi:MAG: hypothetical protein AN484_27575, partial [Aphanizomenon flos-aquae WA102]